MRQIRRAFIVSNGQPLTTGDLMKRCYPRGYDYSSWRYAEVRLAASRYAVRIGRSKTSSGRPWLWAPKLGE